MKNLSIATLAAAAFMTAGLAYGHGEEAEEKRADSQHEMTEQTAHEKRSEHSHGGADQGGMGHSDWTSPEEAANRLNPVEATPESIERGKIAYQPICASCHGVEAKGDGPLASLLSPAPPDLVTMAPMHPAGDLAWKIETGRGTMPAWRGTLSDTRIWDIVNYLKSLAGDGDEGTMGHHDGGHNEDQPAHGNGTGEHDSAETEVQNEGRGSDGHESSGVISSGHEHESAASDPDSEAIAMIADQLYQAIRSGDSDTVRTLLAPDVLIFESGNAETSLEEFAGHHMPADTAFLAKMDKTLLSRQVTAGTDVTVISSRSRLSGFYQETEHDIISTETLVLQRTNGDWQVVHVHWSSSP